MRWMLIVVMLVGLLAACGGDDATPADSVDTVSTQVAAAVQGTMQAQPTDVPQPSETQAIIPTAIPMATNTEVPSTATTEPTHTPRPINTPKPTRTPRPDPTVAPPAEFTIGPGGGPEYTDGHYVTIHSIEDPVTSSNQFLQPDAGNRFLSLDTEICAGTEESSANPYDFAFQMPDNTRRDPGVGIREPALNATQLAPSDCVRGWTTFQIPEGQTPAFIIYEGPGYKPSKFVWP